MGCIDLRRPSSNNTCTKVAPLSRCSRRASDANISAANSSNRRRTAASSPGVMHQSQRADAAGTRANEVLLVECRPRMDRQRCGWTGRLTEVERGRQIAQLLGVLADVGPRVGAAGGGRVDPLATEEGVLDELVIGVEREHMVIDEALLGIRTDHHCRYS